MVISLRFLWLGDLEAGGAGDRITSLRVGLVHFADKECYVSTPVSMEDQWLVWSHIVDKMGDMQIVS